MGLFSCKCMGCGKPVLHSLYPHVPGKLTTWMSWVVVIMPDGEKFTGEYDGYGRCLTPEPKTFWNPSDLYQKGSGEPKSRWPTVFHIDCYDGQGYSGAAEDDPDQGHFWAPDESDPKDPSYPQPKRR